MSLQIPFDFAILAVLLSFAAGYTICSSCRKITSRAGYYLLPGSLSTGTSVSASARAASLSLSATARGNEESKTSRNFILAYDMGKNTRAAVDNRDSLPYVVMKAGARENEEEELGTYLLDPSTGCGDILELGDKGVFQVKNVKFLYKFNGKDFIVVKKKAMAKQLKNPWKRSAVINEDAENYPDDQILQ